MAVQPQEHQGYQLLPPTAFEALHGDADTQIKEMQAKILKLTEQNKILLEQSKIQESEFVISRSVDSLKNSPQSSNDSKQLYLENLVMRQASKVSELEQQISQLNVDDSRKTRFFEDQMKQLKEQQTRKIESLQQKHQIYITEVENEFQEKDDEKNMLILKFQIELKEKNVLIQKLQNELKDKVNSQEDQTTSINFEKDVHVKNQEDTICTLQQQMEVANTKMQQQHQQIERLENDLVTMATDLLQKDEKISSQNKEIKSLNQQLQQLETKMQSKTIEVLESEKDALQSQLNVYSKEKQHLESSNKLLNIQLSSINEILNLQEKELLQMQNEKCQTVTLAGTRLQEGPRETIWDGQLKTDQKKASVMELTSETDIHQEILVQRTCSSVSVPSCNHLPSCTPHFAKKRFAAKPKKKLPLHNIHFLDQLYKTKFYNNDEYEALLIKRWREKVFSLLVQNKSTIIHQENENVKWKEKVSNIQNELNLSENQVQISNHSLLCKQAELDITFKENKKLKEDIACTNDRVSSQQTSLQHNHQLVQCLQECSENVSKKFDEFYQMFGSMNRKLTSYAQRIQFASSRVLLLKDIMAKQKYLSSLQQGEDTKDTEDIKTDNSAECVESIPDHILVELEQVQKERNSLATQLSGITAGVEERIQAEKSKYESQIFHLSDELFQRNLSFQESSKELENISNALSDLQNVLTEKIHRIESLESELDKQKLESNEELRIQKNHDKEELVKKMVEMDEKLNEARREHIKAVISLQQKDRQLDREKTKFGLQMDNYESHIQFQLTETEKELHKVKTERNLMMATLRQEGLIGEIRLDRHQLLFDNNCEIRAQVTNGCQTRTQVIDDCQIRAQIMDSCQTQAQVFECCQTQAQVIECCQTEAQVIDGCQSSSMATLSENIHAEGNTLQNLLNQVNLFAKSVYEEDSSDEISSN